MEKVMSVEERIRRAEDIYNRRNGVCNKSVLNEKKIKSNGKKRNIKRLFMQIFVCLSIYLIFYAVTNRDYIFSEEFRNSVGTFFNEKIKISDWYNSAIEYIQNLLEDDEKNDEKEGDVENIIDNKENQKQNENNEEVKKEETKDETKDETKEEAKEEVKEETKEEVKGEVKDETKEENIGGAEENTENIGKKKDEKLTEQELMEKDAEEIKKNISFIVPIKGRISSTFGWRNPTTNTVPKYHTGLDIAAEQGTKIKSATDGKVIMASSAGDYGKHYQIEIKDVIIIYAHCKKLYLKEGDIVKQGQVIAEVGTTGNSTGPHLHFEIRKNGRKIDPQLVLEF